MKDSSGRLDLPPGVVYIVGTEEHVGSLTVSRTGGCDSGSRATVDRRDEGRLLVSSASDDEHHHVVEASAGM